MEIVVIFSISYDMCAVELNLFYVSLLFTIGKNALIVFSIFETLCDCLSCLAIEKNQNIQNDSTMKIDLIAVTLSNHFKNLYEHETICMLVQILSLLACCDFVPGQSTSTTDWNRIEIEI